MVLFEFTLFNFSIITSRPNALCFKISSISFKSKAFPGTEWQKNAIFLDFFKINCIMEISKAALNVFKDKKQRFRLHKMNLGRNVKMIKKTALMLFLIIAPCHAMHMDTQQVARNMETVDESTINELIRQLLSKSYIDMVSELSKLSEEQIKSIKSVLNKSHSLSTTQVRLHTILSDPQNGWVSSVCFSPDGCHALTASSVVNAHLWDLTKSPCTSRPLLGHRSYIRSVAFSPNGRFALTGSDDMTARLWDLSQSPITSQKLTDYTHFVSSVAFSPNGEHALTASFDTTAHLWDLTKSPFTSQILAGHTGQIRSVAFSPNGRFALTGSDDMTARLWDLTQSPITHQVLTGHSHGIQSVAFSPDGRSALTGSNNKTARLWDLTKSPITSQELKGHRSNILSVAFSPNGRYALTGSWDKTARLWDLTKSPITSHILQGHTLLITSVAFSPDSRFILTGSYDQTARIWQVDQIDSILPIEDSLLILKLNGNDNGLKDDSDALNRLELIVKDPQQDAQTIKRISDYLYRIKFPEQECCICTENYDPEARICMQLPCCKKQICKVCLDKLGGMSYSSEFDGYQFEHSVKNKCPYCNKPTDQMGPIKKFDSDKNNDNRGDKNV